MTADTASPRTDELKRALLAIRDLRRRVDELEESSREPIAIIGTACRLPGGADTPERLWDLLRDGVDATCDVPKDRWDADAIYDPDPNSTNGSYVRRGGFLTGPIDRFDAGFFGISPREASAMDPMHRLLLEMAWESLERAGIAPYSLENTRTGVFTGLSVSDYDTIQKGSGLQAIHSYRGTGTIASIAGGRISHLLGLQGPNFPVDTACSSGLVAVTLAVQQLRARQCDLALAGSVALMLSPEATVFLCRMRALAADGRCRTFDAAASGYSRGEGGGMLVLKRLSEAIADEDPVLAVIRGVACNHDGRSSGLTVPNPVAQRLVIEAALADAGVEPTYVNYVEAHGTATQLGDPIELRALSEVLCRGRAADQPLLLGSIKTNLGHLEAAAGITGILKVVAALTHRQIPPHLHLQSPTPHIDWARLPLHVPTTLTPWTTTGGPRAAGVSAFGFSGTNAHVIIEEAPLSPARAEKPQRPVQIVALSGRSRTAVKELAERYREQFTRDPAVRIEDLGRTSTAGRSHHAFRAVAQGATRAELQESLWALQQASDAAITQVRSADPGGLAFLFTGQGAQSPAMARELWETAPPFRAALERCAAILEPHLDRPLLPLLLDESESAALDQTMYTQPALFTFEYALAELWRDWGIEPAYVLGHSLGEYVAATVAGVLDLEEALPLVALRGRLMQALPSGGRMVAIFAAAALVERALDGIADVAVAAFNGPANVVVSGSQVGVAELLRRLETEKLRCTELKVSHAFHSPLMEPMLAPFEAALRKIRFHEPRIGLVSNVTGELMTAAEAADVVRWRRHVREPVRFGASVERLVALGCRTFLEVGPHPTLAGLGMESAPANNLRWLPSLRRGKPAWKQLGESVGALYCAGHEIDWRGWNRDYAGKRIAAATYPFQRDKYWFTDLTPTPSAQRHAAGTLAAADAARHPLLGARLSSPALSGWVFQRSLEARQPEFLTDHRIRGGVVVPGAAFIEMMRAAASEGPGWPAVRLTNVTFERPLLLADDEVKTCQIIMSAEQDGRATVQVAAAQATDGVTSWTVHATAVAERLEAALQAAEPLAVHRARATQPVVVDDMYARLTARGIDYGPSFRTIVECATGVDAAVGRAELKRGAVDAIAYGMHPCLLDAGFQVLASLPGSAANADETFLPAGVDDGQFARALGAVCWIHGVVRPQADPNLFLADITFYGENGEPCAALIGYRARRVKGRLAAAAQPSVETREPFYAVEWTPVEWPAAASVDCSGDWLLLDDGSAMVENVADWLQRAGARCVRLRRGATWHGDGDHWTVAPAEPGSWDAVNSLAPARGWRGIVDFWALETHGREDADSHELSQRLADGCMALAALVRAAVADGPAIVRIVTRGAAGPDGPAPAVWEEGVALWGLLPVVQAEYPHIDCRAIDLDPDDVAPSAERLAELLFVRSDEDRVAVRHNKLLAARLVRAEIDSAAGTTLIPDGENYRGTIEQRGTLDALRYAPAVRVAPQADEIEIRVRATGLNFRDVLNVLGMYPGDPGLPGVEVAGTVVRAGAKVKHVRPGDGVFGLAGGAFAAYVTVSAAGVVKIPAELSAEEAATIPLAFLTAEWGLTHLAKMRAGDRVLIHAAAGGVGQAAVQLALAAGAEVFATAGSDEKRSYLQAQGVRHIFDSRSASFADEIHALTGGRGVDIVLNSLIGPMLHRSLALLGRGGRFIELGKAELLDAADVARLHPGVAYHSFDLGGVLFERPDDFQALFRGVAARFADRQLRPLRLRTYAPEEITDAFRFMAQARHIGKVVIASRATLRRASNATAIRADAAYLVTGATGGIGRTLIEWLARRGAGAIVANARTELQPELAKRLDALRAEGHVIEFIAGDVADPAEARRVIDAATALRMPLAGIFHAAGVLDDGMLADLTRERFLRVFRPKVAAAWNLHRATRALEIEHFVMFGSIAGVMGGAGQGNYASANAFLAGLAEHRRRSGLAATTVEWGAWAGEGMAGRLAERERLALENRGLGFLTAERGVELLERILGANAARYVVAAIDWRRLGAVVRGVPPLLRKLLTQPESGEPAVRQAVSAPDRGELARAEPSERRARLADYVRAALGAVLGTRPGQLDDDTEVGQYGFDSLMAMEFRNRVEKDIGVLVPVSKLLGSATPVELANELAAALESVGLAASAKTDLDEGEI